MAAQHGPGGHWSATNPIPTVQKFLEGLDQDKKERDRQIDEENRRKEQYQREQDKHREQEETDAAPHTAPLVPRSKGRKVTDPTTGKEVEIDDVGKEFMKAVKDPQLSVPNANLGKDSPIKTEPTQTAEEYKYAQDVTAPPDPIAEGTTSDVPIRGEKTNILFHPTPTVSFEPMYKALEKRAGIVCIATFIGIVFPGKFLGASLKGLIPLAFCIASAIWLWMQDLISRGRANEWYSEQRRGESATANLLPESVEWMNNFMAIVWGLLNPDMFASVGDTIEDVMQASVPGVVENVRVAEISQGSNPFRILSMRALPDSHANQLKESLAEHNKKNKSPQEAAADMEGGDHYNLEISFAYHAKPSDASSSTKAANMHMLLVFYLGIKGLFGVPLPIFAELKEFVGTVRLRLQLTPDPPFAKTVTFSLMGLPHVRAGCTPMVKTGVNILNLPLISNFVNYAIGAAASLYVAPKSMSLDVRMMLQGDDIQKETQALGIMWVRIHRAIGLSKQDSRGSEGGGSDPYINLSFSKYGKPMYCTRVITDDLNPVWEEHAALLVNPELLKADEQLSVELWDSDRNTADDIVGKVELSMQEMIQHPGKMFPMTSKLQGMHADTEMPGELHWEVGYFGKPQFRPALLTDGKDPNLLPNMRDNPALQDDKGNLNTDYDYAVTHTPPDPLWPSGICSIVIHQIVNLQLAEIKGSYGRGNRKDKEYIPAKAYGENTEEQGKNLPTSYCTILLNDNLVYRTRAKAVTSKPIFNAGTERFVRDWRSAIVTVTVRDQRYREHDPILGVVPLKLSDILQTSSQATRWYPLDGGIGFGRIRISLLFRSVETKLPPQILGWDVGTFEFVSDRINIPGYNHHAKLKVRTSGVAGTLPRSSCTHDKANGGSFFDISTHELKNRIRIPVKHRHRSAIIFELHGGGPTGYATVWLNEVVDNTDIPIDVPVWSTKMPNRLTQNYITESNWQDKRSPGLEDLTQIGRLQFTCLFSPGIDESHEAYVNDNNSRETFETWEACLSEGVRERSVSNELPRTVRELHEKSLVEGRDILRQQEQLEQSEQPQQPEQPEQSPQTEQPEHQEQSHWVSADGTDFRKAFGDNPDALAADDRGSQGTDMEAEGQRQRYSTVSGGSLSAGSRGSYNTAEAQDLHGMPDGLPHGEEGSGGPSEYRGNRSSGSMEQNRVSMGEMRDHLNQDAASMNRNRGGSSSSLEQHGDDDMESFTTSSTNRRSGETEEERLRRIGDRANKRAERRKMRGSMQWKPVRNAAFAKHESEFALNKLKKKFGGGLTGREPGVETEAGA